MTEQKIYISDKNTKHNYQALQTYQTINRYLYDDVSRLVYQYMCGPNIDELIDSKKAGELGICELITQIPYGFYGACSGGHLEIVKLMIEKGSNIEVVKLMLETGVTYWNLGLYYACKGRHVEIINLMIKKGANNWNWGLHGACEGGNLDAIMLMIEKGANDWKNGLLYACRSGHLAIAQLMIEKGATNLNIALTNAKKHNHIYEYIQNIINNS